MKKLLFLFAVLILLAMPSLPIAAASQNTEVVTAPGAYLYSYTAGLDKISFEIKQDKNSYADKMTNLEVRFSTDKHVKHPKAFDFKIGESPYVVKELLPHTTYYFEVIGYYMRGDTKVYVTPVEQNISRVNTSKPFISKNGEDIKNILEQFNALPKSDKAETLFFDFPIQTSRQKAWEYVNYWQALYPEYFLMSEDTVRPVFSGDQFMGIKVKKVYSYNEASKRAQKVNKKIDKIVKEAKKKPSAKEKITYVNDAISDRLEYDKSTKKKDNGSPYCIVTGDAVCNGYSTVFYACMHRLHMPCIIRLSNSKPMHSWNLVKTKGKWEHIDTCWNDGQNTHAYMWMSDSEVKQLDSHQYDDEFFTLFKTAISLLKKQWA